MHGLASDGVLLLRPRGGGSLCGGGFGGAGLFDDDLFATGRDERDSGGSEGGYVSVWSAARDRRVASDGGAVVPPLGDLLDRLGCRPPAAGPPQAASTASGGARELFVFLAPDGIVALAEMDGWGS